MKPIEHKFDWEVPRFSSICAIATILWQLGLKKSTGKLGHDDILGFMSRDNGKRRKKAHS